MNVDKKELIEILIFYLKGLLMGIADVIPGVSGGTIAFITGIYSRLINSVSSLKTTLFSNLVKGELNLFKIEFKQIDWKLFLPLGAGIGTAIITLSGLMSYLLESHTANTFALFFGLILASAVIVVRQIDSFKFEDIVFLVLGICFGFVMSSLPVFAASHSMPIILISGFIAISAMLLPGVSGAFLLVLLGQYEFVVNAIHERNLVVVFFFGLGAIFGLFVFSRVINYLLKNFKHLTFSFLVGLMIGALKTPYTKVISSEFSLILVLVFGIVGFLIALLLDFIPNTNSTNTK